jgi:hypothetical protein
MKIVQALDQPPRLGFTPLARLRLAVGAWPRQDMGKRAQISLSPAFLGQAAIEHPIDYT